MGLRYNTRETHEILQIVNNDLDLLRDALKWLSRNKPLTVNYKPKHVSMALQALEEKAAEDATTQSTHLSNPEINEDIDTPGEIELAK